MTLQRDKKIFFLITVTVQCGFIVGKDASESTCPKENFPTTHRLGMRINKILQNLLSTRIVDQKNYELTFKISAAAKEIVFPVRTLLFMGKAKHAKLDSLRSCTPNSKRIEWEFLS